MDKSLIFLLGNRGKITTGYSLEVKVDLLNDEWTNLGLGLTLVILQSRVSCLGLVVPGTVSTYYFFN